MKGCQQNEKCEKNLLKFSQILKISHHYFPYKNHFQLFISSSSFHVLIPWKTKKKRWERNRKLFWCARANDNFLILRSFDVVQRWQWSKFLVTNVHNNDDDVTLNVRKKKMLLNCQNEDCEWGEAEKQAKPIDEHTSIARHDINYSYTAHYMRISLTQYIVRAHVRYGSWTEVQRKKFLLCMKFPLGCCV